MHVQNDFSDLAMCITNVNWCIFDVVLLLQRWDVDFCNALLLFIHIHCSSRRFKFKNSRQLVWVCGVCSANAVQKSTNQTAKIQRKTTVWRLIRCRVKTICYKTVIKRFQCASFHGIFSCYSLAAHFLTLHFYFSHSKRIRILCNMQYHSKRKGTCSWECLLFLSLCDLFEVFQEKYTHTHTWVSFSWMHSTLFRKYLHWIFVKLLRSIKA